MDGGMSQSLRSEAWLLRGISSLPGELILERGMLQFVAHGTGSIWPGQLRTLEQALRMPGLATSIDRDGRSRLFAWRVNAVHAWAPWYYFAGGIKLAHAGVVLSFSFGRPANMEVRRHADGFGAIAEVRKQVESIRRMRDGGRGWLAALGHGQAGG